MNHPTKNNLLARARREDLVVQEMTDEVLIYDLKSHKAHCLNETAAFVWNHCDGKTAATELAALMEKQWSRKVDEGVVWLALKQLSRAELLEERVVTNGDATRASRRAVLRKLGAAAAMTPLVISIIAPTASAGSSIPPVCQACVKKSTGIADCPNVCTTNGTCYGNSGCGFGQRCDCRTCASCFSGQCTCGSPGNDCQAATASWVAPGDLNCV